MTMQTSFKEYFLNEGAKYNNADIQKLSVTSYQNRWTTVDKDVKIMYTTGSYNEDVFTVEYKKKIFVFVNTSAVTAINNATATTLSDNDKLALKLFLALYDTFKFKIAWHKNDGEDSYNTEGDLLEIRFNSRLSIESSAVLFTLLKKYSNVVSERYRNASKEDMIKGYGRDGIWAFSIKIANYYLMLKKLPAVSVVGQS